MQEENSSDLEEIWDDDLILLLCFTVEKVENL